MAIGNVIADTTLIIAPSNGFCVFKDFSTKPNFINLLTC